LRIEIRKYYADYLRSVFSDSTLYRAHTSSCIADIRTTSYEEIMSSSQRAEITLIPADLPDHAVLNKPQVCSLINLSEDTLARLHQNGEGPARVQLSARRVGYTVGAVREWLQKRASASAA
jgi:predicted DNA-binding transcriptional regulator AlpA